MGEPALQLGALQRATRRGAGLRACLPARTSRKLTGLRLLPSPWHRCWTTTTCSRSCCRSCRARTLWSSWRVGGGGSWGDGVVLLACRRRCGSCWPHPLLPTACHPALLIGCALQGRSMMDMYHSFDSARARGDFSVLPELHALSSGLKVHTLPATGAGVGQARLHPSASPLFWFVAAWRPMRTDHAS